MQHVGLKGLSSYPHSSHNGQDNDIFVAQGKVRDATKVGGKKYLVKVLTSECYR